MRTRGATRGCDAGFYFLDADPGSDTNPDVRCYQTSLALGRGENPFLLSSAEQMDLLPSPAHTSRRPPQLSPFPQALRTFMKRRPENSSLSRQRVACAALRSSLYEIHPHSAGWRDLQAPSSSLNPREGLTGAGRAGVLRSCRCLRSDPHPAGRLPLPAHTWEGKPRRGDEVWVPSDVWGEVEGGQMKVQG